MPVPALATALANAPLHQQQRRIDGTTSPVASVNPEAGPSTDIGLDEDIFGLDDLIKKSGATMDGPSEEDPPIIACVSSIPSPKATMSCTSQNPVNKNSRGKSSLYKRGSIKAVFFQRPLNMSNKSTRTGKKSDNVKQGRTPEFRIPSIAEEIAGTRDMSKALGVSFDGVMDDQIHAVIL